MENQTPLHILSLDGGGVRRILSLYILQELMDQIKLKFMYDKPDEPIETIRSCELFDLICGTSTDGLTAIMLGRLEMISFDPQHATYVAIDRGGSHCEI